MSENKRLTTNAGCPVADNQGVMTAGRRGPHLLQDVWFLVKLAHFDGNHGSTVGYAPNEVR